MLATPHLFVADLVGPDVLVDDVFASVDLLTVAVAALDANPPLVFSVEAEVALHQNV